MLAVDVLGIAHGYLASLLLVALLKAVKYERLGGRARLSCGDLSANAVWVGVLASLLLIDYPAAKVASALTAVFLITALWLDAVLFAIFTIELGPGGVGDIVVSILARELGELGMARRFISGHKLFLLLPLGGIAMWGSLAADAGGWLWSLAIALQIYLGAAVAFMPSSLGPGLLWLGRAALLVARGMGWHASPGWLLIAPGIWVMGALARLFGVRVRPFFRQRSLLREFLWARPLPRVGAWSARTEHASLAHLKAQPWRPSALHGTLRGESVVLISIESLGRDHLHAYSPGGARVPWLEELERRGVVSQHHFCVSPTTNNAHRALYLSAYAEAGARDCLAATCRQTRCGSACLPACC